MATVVNQTRWSLTKSTTSLTVTIPATAPGNTLIVHAYGGALVTSRITNSTGTLFTKRIEVSSTQAVSHSDYPCVGGETAVYLSLNGAENVAGVIYEVSGLGAYIGSSSMAATTIAASGDWQAKPTSSVTLASGNGVLFGAWSITETAAIAPFSAANTWRQMGPIGKLWNTGGQQPGANAQFIWASGIADVTSTGSYPENLPAGQYRATSVWNQNSNTAWAVQALYANAGAAVNNAPTNQVAGENSLPGTAAANWNPGQNQFTNSTIAGYCDKTSYQPGDTVNFKVDSTGNAFRVEIYRLGWYGDEGFGARNVLGQGTYLTGTVVTQPAPTVDATLGSTSCAWTTNATWTIPATACPGVYLVTYRRTDVTTNAATGVFTVRPASVAGKVTVVSADSTWQAYNLWGATTDSGVLGTGTYTGRSLYSSGADGATSNFAHRAYAVSFDRPWATQSQQANTWLMDAEYGTIHFLEAQGFNLAYLSCIDLEGDPSILTKASMVIANGHHEYWTTNMYDAFTRAADAGVNTLVNSSNTALWRVRFAAADTNKRTMICYKDSGSVDVSAGFDGGTGRDPGGYTGTWRDARTTTAPNNPDVRRENALTGQLFAVSAPSNVQTTVPFANKGAPVWRNSAAIQALTAGQSYTNANANVGDEVDLPDGSAGQPGNVVSLSPTSGSWTTGANTNGTIYHTSVSGTASLTVYRRHSGALVANTGSWRYWWGITRWAKGTLAGTVASSAVDWQNALLCLMYDLGAHPAAVTALRPGVDTAPTDPATGAPTGGNSGVALAYGVGSPENGDANVFFTA